MLSLKEVRQKIQAITEAIEKRERQLSLIEQENNIEEIVKAPMIRNEIKILESEKQKLIQLANELKAKYKKSLPEAENRYFESISRQKSILNEIAKKSRDLLLKINELQSSIDQAHADYINYQIICNELAITPKNRHLQDCYPLWQARRWLQQFLDWFEKTRWVN